MSLILRRRTLLGVEPFDPFPLMLTVMGMPEDDEMSTSLIAEEPVSVDPVIAAMGMPTTSVDTDLDLDP